MHTENPVLRILSLRALAAGLAVLFLLLFAGRLAAQPQNPNHERGFSPEKAFQVGDLDHVNLFNGNLVVTLPIGQQYPLDGGVSYGLTLSYNVVSWEFEEICPSGDFQCYNSARPMLEDNAGFGWLLTMGRLERPLSPWNATGSYIYVGPDGADHTFYQTLHEGDTYQTGNQFTRDGSYLRMKDLGAYQEVEFPDGVIHKLTDDNKGDLVQIRGPLVGGATRAYVNVTPVYSGSNLVRWDVADSEGRTHTVHFATYSVDGRTAPLVTSVIVAGWGGGSSTYTFSYTSGTVKRPPQHDYPGLAWTATVQFLTQVTVKKTGTTPVLQTYKMSVGNPQREGMLEWLELPTGGRIEYTTRFYTFPRRLKPKESPTSPDPSEDPYQTSIGISTRKLVDNTTSLGQWSYTQFLDVGNSRTVMTDPLGHTWTHYFRAAPDDTTHGLPYTSATTDGAGRFLSTQVTPAGTSTPVRSTYVRYEWDRTPQPDVLKQDNPGDVNRRVASEKTVYHDDGAKIGEVTYSGFDGLGHYRTATTSGTFAASDVLSTTTRYNNARGTYLHLGTGTGHTFTMWPSSSPWILNTYDEQSETEGGVTAKRQYCFDAGTGFLLRERVQKGSTAGTTDVLRVYTQESTTGNLIREQHYGGDTQGLGTTALCSLALPSTDQVRIDHGYAAGTLATSEYKTAAGASLGFKHLDLTIDAGTGLPTTSRDTTGLATSYEYDGLGRVTWVKPALAHGGWSEYVYTPGAPGVKPWVAIRQRANGSTTATVLSNSEVHYDAFGRVWREKKMLPNGLWSTKETGTNALGWKTYVTETDTQTSPAQRTQYLSYDPFGRPAVIRPADGSAHDVSFTYTGVRVVVRKVQLATAYSTSTGAHTESEIKTREIYDRQGRLWRVWEDDGGTQSAMTEYLYDVGNRLKKVSMSRPEGAQTRWFTYDHRGFLASEQHPEKGAFGNGVVSYGSFDSRGKPGRKTDGPQDHTLTYDRAERLTQVKEAAGSLRILETRTYGTGTGTSDRSAGKLKTATRNNYHERWGVNFPVVQTYTYGGRDGRVSQLLTTINSNDSYTQTFLWNELGNLASQTYPTCNHCPVGTVPARTVSYSYGQGFLTAVPSWASSITYHPNGLVNQVTHANGVVSTQANDPNRMKRPASITVAKSTSTLFATGAYAYDGAGNVKKVGTDYYVYDRLGRLKEGTAFQAGNYRQTYGFDSFGNLTAVTSYVNGVGSTRTHAVAATTNRLSLGGYDAAGNQTTWGSYVYSWDPTGAMKSYQGGGNDWAYAYDADGERYLVYNAATGASTFRLRGLDQKTVREVKLSGGVWSWGKDWIYRDGTLLATVAPGTDGIRYAHADHLGSPRIFTDALGAKRESYHYYPFGEQAGAAPAAAEALRFTGHERDGGVSTGTADDLDYMHARYYHPQLGRFMGADPINTGKPGKGVSWNKYAYVNTHPLNYVDPTGKDGRIAIQLDQDNQQLLNGEITTAQFQDRVSSRGKAAVFVASLFVPGPEDVVIGAVAASKAGGLLARVAAVLRKGDAAADGVPHRTFKPGNHAGESIPAQSTSPKFSASERSDINKIGQETGCHTCGTKEPGTKSGNFVPDHQPPSALNADGVAQKLYPQCLNCSREQGLAIARERRVKQ